LSRLEEQVTEQYNNAELHRRHRVETRRLSVDTPENRFVKMVLTRCTRNITNFIAKARKSDSSPEDGRLSRTFYDELAGWKKPLEQRLTSASEMQAAQNWNDLSDRYASFVDKSAAAI
jgi:uncharacterized protein